MRPLAECYAVADSISSIRQRHSGYCGATTRRSMPAEPSNFVSDPSNLSVITPSGAVFPLWLISMPRSPYTPHAPDEKTQRAWRLSSPLMGPSHPEPGCALTCTSTPPLTPLPTFCFWRFTTSPPSPYRTSPPNKTVSAQPVGVPGEELRGACAEFTAWFEAIARKLVSIEMISP